MALPDIANVTCSPDKGSLAAMNADPAFRAVVSLRTNSTDLARVGGFDECGSADINGLARRHDLIELTRFGDGGEAAYRDYEHTADTLRAQYGYHVERRFRPMGDTDGLSFIPDVVTVAYFDTGTAMGRFHADAGHADLYGSGHTAAVAQSVQLMARARVTPPMGTNVSHR